MPSWGFETTGEDVIKAYGNQAEGKVIVITGTSDGGLGAETAIALAAAKPARLILLARSANKVQPVIEKIKAVDASINADFVPIELDDFDSVRTAARKITDMTDKIDILINNAGIMAVPDFTTNKSGIETQFATNHLGHFLLTALLFDKVVASGKGARIVNLTSDGHKLGPCRLEDYNFKNGSEYGPWSGYGQSKTANILFTRYLASRLGPKGILSVAVHPGVIMATSLGKNLDDTSVEDLERTALRETGKVFHVGAEKTHAQGISGTLVAALDPRMEENNGAYLEDGNVVEAYEYATAPDNVERLWALSEELVGQKFDI